jgi:hypothetical protein
LTSEVNIEAVRARLVELADRTAPQAPARHTSEYADWDSIRRIRLLRQKGDYSSCIRELPAVMDAIAAKVDSHQAAVQVSLDAAFVLSAAGYNADGWIAARGCIRVGRESGDVASHAAALFAASRLATRIGSYDQAQGLAQQGILEVSAAMARGVAARSGSRGALFTSLIGMLHLAAGYALAHRGITGSGRSVVDAVADNVTVARDSAVDWAGPDPYGLAFGPPTVVAWQVGCDLALGRLSQARAHAAKIQWNQLPHADLQACFLIDVARAWSTDASSVGVAAAHLRRAEMVAPQVVLHSFKARQCVTDLLRVARRGQLPSGLRGLASRLGLA